MSDGVVLDSNSTNDNGILILIVCLSGLFIDGYILYISSIALPLIQKQYALTAFELGLTQSVTLIGAAFGAIIFGKLSDKLGRKKLLIYNLLFFIVVSVLSALSWSVLSLIAFRLLIGVAVGMDYPICAAYMVEMIEKSKIKQYVAIAMCFNCLASPVGVVIAWIIISLYPQTNAWRLILASSAIWAVLALFLRSKLPESIVWKRQKQQELKNCKLPFRKHFRMIISREYLKMTLAFSCIWFFMNIAYYGIGSFTPMIIASFNLSSQSNVLTSIQDVIYSTLLVNLFILAGAFCSIWLIQRINSIYLQKIGLLMSFIGLATLSLSSISSVLVINMTLLFGGFILFNFFINLGPGITTYLLPAEYYPTEIKATGHGFASGIAKSGAFLGAISLPVLQFYLGIYITIFMVSITLLIGFLITGKLFVSDNLNSLT
ncbi:MFS transporter [Thiotrichales bacterium 19S3-7]|nr:MFS transporter [Thiotrichales bacterium 19S3-7]MCF6802727.1 MFS transporter [Thiotrichales bacterium 19S3-11]